MLPRTPRRAWGVDLGDRDPVRPVIFNEFRFLVLFLPGIALAFYFGREWRREILLCGSLLFYAFSGIQHAVILSLGVVWVFAFCRSDAIGGNRWRLTLAIAGPAVALVYYKYADFFLDPAAWLLGGNNRFSLFENVILPAGISFFTFQMAAFAFDRYRGRIETAPAFLDFALHIAFFPQLVAGPILRFPQVSEAIENLERFVPTKSQVAEAAGYVVFGLGIKVILADSLSVVMAPAVAAPGALNALAGLYVILGFSFQIYFDFYGYSLIAIGLGCLFGFQFPANFLRPYESQNPREFWRRWHVSLSYWIRDYIYLPLGGNKRYVRNILIVFAAAGLWHGAGWNFVVWGLYHAALVIGYSRLAPWWDRMPGLLQRVLNFSLVSFGWLLFLFDFNGGLSLLSSLANWGGSTVPVPGFLAWALLALAAVACFGLNIESAVARRARGLLQDLPFSGGLAAILFASLLLLDRSQTFIYFRF